MNTRLTYAWGAVILLIENRHYYILNTNIPFKMFK